MSARPQIPAIEPGNPVPALVAACERAKRELLGWMQIYTQDPDTNAAIVEINDALKKARATV